MSSLRDLVFSPLPTHGLRRGLHSIAASRLEFGGLLHTQAKILALPHTLKPRFYEGLDGG